MDRDVTDGGNASTPAGVLAARPVQRAVALIDAAAAADRVAFGQAYAAVIEPELDTEAVVLLFSFVRAAYADFAAGERVAGAPAADTDDAAMQALDRIHRLATTVYGLCSDLIEVNLAALEHVLRSVLGTSSYLANLDGYAVALYLAVLAGGLRRAAADSGIELTAALAVAPVAPVAPGAPVGGQAGAAR